MHRFGPFLPAQSDFYDFAKQHCEQLDGDASRVLMYKSCAIAAEKYLDTM